MRFRRASTCYLLAASSGMLQVLIFPRFGLSWLAVVALVPLLVAVTDEPRLRARFLLGWLTGIIFWGGVCYWIYDVMHRYAHLSAPAATAIFAGFFIVKGLHLGVFSAIAGPLMTRWWAVPVVAAAWVAVEGSHQYLAFTWLQLGNAGIDLLLLARAAPFTGVYGVSFLLAMVNVAVACLVLRRTFREMAWLVVVPSVLLLPPLPAEIEGRETVRLVQPNFHPDELIERGWNPIRQATHWETMQVLSTAAAEAIDPSAPTLVVWPEYPAPSFYARDPHFRDYVAGVARKLGAPLILNSVEYLPSNAGRPLNSAIALDSHGDFVSRYSKIFRVPFGEFVPWPFSLFVEKITLAAGDFLPGEEVVVSRLNGHSVGTFICYESVFARGVRRFTAAGAEVLVNISNDSWYGRTAARHQHLLIARMRAVENARWLLRATNDGITSVIDPAGRVTASLRSFQQGVLVTSFDYSAKSTWFVSFGEWFWWLTLAAAVASLLAVAKREVR